MDPEGADLSLAASADGDGPQSRPGRPADHLGGVNWPSAGRAPLQGVPSGPAGPVPGARAAPAAIPRPAVSVLADRLAAALVHHEPGWRLPRHSALARRYSVSTAEIDAAIGELIGRHLVRRLADGQLYRASPAEYIIGLEGVPGLASYVDAMGGEFTCRSRHVSWRLPPEDISWALRVPAAEAVCVLRFLWTAGGEPAAFCTTYVPGDIAGRPEASASQPLPATLNLLELSAGVADGLIADWSGQQPDRPSVVGVPGALHVEMQSPPPSVARSLRLSAGQPAMMVIVRFDDQAQGKPVALTVAVLRADMFRLVLQSAEPPLPRERTGSLASSWTDAAEDWEP
jgi:DNA-binding GntR family transcriptional regulator